MYNEKSYALGSNRSCIRELFEYGCRRAEIVGRENVYDYSLGNPSVPAPAEVDRAIRDILTDTDSVAVHGYTSAVGDLSTRKAIAEDLNSRYNANVKPENLMITCGAAPGLTAVFRALAVENGEILAVAPFFPEYRPFAEGAGLTFKVVPPDVPDFQIQLSAVEQMLSRHTVALILNSPNNPSGVVYTRDTLEKLAALLEKRRQNTATLFIWCLMSPTGSWSTAMWKCPSCRAFIPIPLSATLIPSPCPCPANASAMCMCRKMLRTARKSMPQLPAVPGWQVTCVRPACGKRLSPAARSCARICRRMTGTGVCFTMR